MCKSVVSLFFFFNDTATTEIYTLSLHDALPISHGIGAHADHLSVFGAELLVAVPERARLDRTARRLVLRIEVQHDRFPAHEIAQPHWHARLIRQREIRRNISNAHLCCLAHARSPFALLQRSVVASWNRQFNAPPPPPPRPASPCSCA